MGGNDFVPPVNDTNIGKNELDFWFDSYHQYRQKHAANFVSSGGSLDLQKFQHFLEFCRSRSTLRHVTDNDIPAQELVDAWCWTLLYYFSGVPSWTHHYQRYHQAPSLKALCASLWRFPRFTIGEPYPPFQQLLTVLPPFSAGTCLPPPFADAFASELKPFCPPKVEVLARPGRAEWDVTVKAPRVPVEVVRKCLRRLLPLCSEGELHRNRNQRRPYHWRGPARKKRRCHGHRVSSTVQ
jgi:5'-3' exonuclease